LHHALLKLSLLSEPEKKIEVRRNIFADFEKQSSTKSMDEGSGAR